MKLFDMTQDIFHACPGWPTYDVTNITYEKIEVKDGFTAERMNLNSHTGTHLDAPHHFFAGRTTVDKIPLDRFIGRARIVNLLGIPPKTGIGKTELAPFLPRIEADDIVLLYTGWCDKRGYTAEYCYDWPYLSGDGAELLLSKKVKGVGVDGLSVGGWYDGTGRPCHEVLLGNDVWLVEELYFPKELLAYETCLFTAVPLKLRGFGGSPVRAYASVDVD